jgi:hypothetical protein
MSAEDVLMQEEIMLQARHLRRSPKTLNIASL